MKTSEAVTEIAHYTLFPTLVHLKKWMKTSEAVSKIAPYTLIPYISPLIEFTWRSEWKRVRL